MFNTNFNFKSMMASLKEVDKDNSGKLVKKLIGQWKKIAGETIKIEMVGSAFYGYGSELATLRLFMKFTNKGKNNPSNKFDAGYSSNLKTHYFRMEI